MVVFVLIAWAVTAGLGVVILVAWLRRRRPGSAFPVRLVVSHIGTAAVAIGLWVASMITGSAWWAWAAFVTLNLTNGLGDAVLTGRVRGFTGIRSTWWRDYRRAVTVVLKGGRPPAPTLHTVTAVVTLVGSFVACLVAT